MKKLTKVEAEKAEELKKEYVKHIGGRLDIMEKHVDLDKTLYSDKQGTEIDLNWAMEQDIKRRYRELVGMHSNKDLTWNGDESSRQGEFHPKSLTKPYVTVSRHTALVIQI